jgi:hypothetical protein
MGANDGWWKQQAHDNLTPMRLEVRMCSLGERKAPGSKTCGSEEKRRDDDDPSVATLGEASKVIHPIIPQKQHGMVTIR